MKKIVIFLSVLVIVLSGLLIFEYMKDDSELENETKSENKSYDYQDVENMGKASSVKDAFKEIFGEGRLFDDYQESDSYSDYEKRNFVDPYNGEIKYHLAGVYPTDSNTEFKYDPNKKYYFQSLYIGITLKSGVDTRKEMIDFLHYLQFSGLSEPHFIKNTLPENSVNVNQINPNQSEKSLPPFNIILNVYRETKPGMNKPEPHQTWKINSDVIEVMDFSDKDDILYSISRYGDFEGYNPSGSNVNN